MNIITLDFETYYDKLFSLSKMTTEEYIRSPEFETIGVAVKENEDETRWFSGSHDEIAEFLGGYDWASSALLAHNAMFDAAILNWRFGIKPRAVLDTLSMARALHGSEVGNSLAKLSLYYELGEKGTEVVDALGKRRSDFDVDALNKYGGYCINDVELTAKLFKKLSPSFKLTELQIISLTVKMFSEPLLHLDKKQLEAHLLEVQYRKAKLLEDCGVESRDELMSNLKFAELLRGFGVEPPMKISPVTGKEALALAKSDEAFKALAEHPDERVQALVAARLGSKSTLEETRTQRFIEISKRGDLPIPLSYYAAHTGRWGGADKINLQNLPSRGTNGGKLKKAIVAPDGYVMIDSDSSQIEARMLAWWAGQDDLTEAFLRKEDVYKKMASAIYNKPVADIEAHERFVGKTTILGAGYGMGAPKFQTQLKTFNTYLELEECSLAIGAYRNTYYKIPELWSAGKKSIEAMVKNQTADFGNGVVQVMGSEGILLPNGLYQRYPNLRKIQTDEGWQYVYDNRKGQTKLYGGKLVENVCQALARCIIVEQMLRIAKKYRPVLTVHDAIACIAPEQEADEAMAYVMECMSWTPDWAEGLPVACEAGYGKSYGDC
jgi:DNA polymerase I-like protein with 3'-5' exonuclease and polymerase domains